MTTLTVERLGLVLAAMATKAHDRAKQCSTRRDPNAATILYSLSFIFEAGAETCISIAEETTMTNSTVAMPIGDTISRANEQFLMDTRYEKQASRNHFQSLARLAERGGLTWREAAAIVAVYGTIKDVKKCERYVRLKLTKVEP